MAGLGNGGAAGNLGWVMTPLDGHVKDRSLQVSKLWKRFCSWAYCSRDCFGMRMLFMHWETSRARTTGPMGLNLSRICIPCVKSHLGRASAFSASSRCLNFYVTVCRMSTTELLVSSFE